MFIACQFLLICLKILSFFPLKTLRARGKLNASKLGGDDNSFSSKTLSTFLVNLQKFRKLTAYWEYLAL